MHEHASSNSQDYNNFQTQFFFKALEEIYTLSLLNFIIIKMLSDEPLRNGLEDIEQAWFLHIIVIPTKWSLFELLHQIQFYFV